MKRFVALLLCAVGLSCAQLMPAENGRNDQGETSQKIRVSAPVDYKKPLPVYSENGTSLLRRSAASETQQGEAKGKSALKCAGIYALAMATGLLTGESVGISDNNTYELTEVAPLSWKDQSSQKYVSPKEQRALEKSAEEK